MFCNRCQAFWQEALSKAEIPPAIKSCEDVCWKSHETTLHLSMRALKRASDSRCRLCRIICYAPTDCERETLLDDMDEPLDVVLSLNTANGPHPVLMVAFQAKAGNVTMLPNRVVASCTGLLGDDDLATTLERSVESENDSTGSDPALELAAFWAKTCLNGHEKCRRPSNHGVTSFLPTRLLDVSKNSIRLVESKHEIADGADRIYLALSHCWGLNPIIRTLISNYNEHRKGIDPERLSKTFREAIHTTRKLGYQYIWIDSLCIKQDDGADWAAEAATMCNVYQYAALTIAAAHAPGGDVGCFAERDGLLHLPFFIELPRSPEAVKPTRIQFTSYGRVKDLGGGDPALYGRAWVLQEQILSPRMLIFDGSHLKWECLSMYGSESSPTSGITRHSLYHKSIRTGIMENFEYFNHPDATDKAFEVQNFWARLKHQYWCYIVMDYTHRGMTKSQDRLVAIAGIGKALNRHTKNRYLAGLWSEYFTTGLLWSLAHTEKFSMSAADNFDVEKNEKIRHEKALAPSWSWASVTAPVMYASNELLNYDRICTVLDVNVVGNIDRQTGRAEIRGHIRRGYVNAVYPYSIREAAMRFPHMTTINPSGHLGREETNFKGRMFHPNDWFLLSEKPPSTGNADIPTQRLTTHGNFRLVRGSFRPDQLIDPSQELTFLAIAQQHFGALLTTRLASHQDDDALKVHSLALIPTGQAKGEYKRVGLAIWDECAWYGYLCGWKDARDRIVERPGRWTEEGVWSKEGWWDKMGRKLWWDDLEFYDETKKGAHQHGYEANCLPATAKYHEKVAVEERTVVIV